MCASRVAPANIITTSTSPKDLLFSLQILRIHEPQMSTIRDLFFSPENACTLIRYSSIRVDID